MPRSVSLVAKTRLCTAPRKGLFLVQRTCPFRPSARTSSEIRLPFRGTNAKRSPSGESAAVKAPPVFASDSFAPVRASQERSSPP